MTREDASKIESFFNTASADSVFAKIFMKKVSHGKSLIGCAVTLCEVCMRKKDGFACTG